ncbi:hypothetical protein L873DRAFT_1666041, partial [Choiromyces venosus 120613-1]
CQSKYSTSGQTLLLWVTWHWHPGVLKILLERKDVNPNEAGTGYGRIPLSLAVRHGHVTVVRMRLEREDLNTNLAEPDDSRTSLTWVARYGYEKIDENAFGT